MIVVQATDGLGNQLFQYAAGCAHAHRCGTTLKLDAYWFSVARNRRFGLSAFNTSARFATLLDIARVCPLEALNRVGVHPLAPWPKSKAERILDRAEFRSPYSQRLAACSDQIPLMIGRVVSERVFHFDPAVITTPNNVAFCGYWQSEKYFADAAAVIRREFTWREKARPAVQQVMEEIAGCESVALHVRRGDKVAEKQATSLEECLRALKFFRSRLARPKFFVFTDDWGWVSRQLPQESDMVYVRRDFADHEDLRLMSSCRHNIVAPSSFSWWAAWLNANPEKLVLRPRQWLNKSNPAFKNYDLRDVFPASWIDLGDA